MATFCEDLKIKVFPQGHVLMEDQGNIEDVIFVRSGSLRVDKVLTFETRNIIPSESKNAHGQRQWDLNKITTEKKITTLIIPPLKFFGL